MLEPGVSQIGSQFGATVIIERQRSGELLGVSGKLMINTARDVTFALYRDFPDPQRRRGDERF